MDARWLLNRLFELVGRSDDYFVTGSLSFLPRLSWYRLPIHDVDVAVSLPLFDAIQLKVRPDEDFRFLRLGQVAIGADFLPGGVLTPRTAFAHLTTPGGLLDLAAYCRNGALAFSLGAGLTLCVPRVVLDRVTQLEWEGFRYRAAPIELAFIPKAVGYLRRRAGRRSRCEDDRKEFQDLVHLAPLVDWGFLGEILEQGGIRWLGRRLPRWLLDPFDTAAVLAVRRELRPAGGALYCPPSSGGR